MEVQYVAVEAVVAEDVQYDAVVVEVDSLANSVPAVPLLRLLSLLPIQVSSLLLPLLLLRLLTSLPLRLLLRLLTSLPLRLLLRLLTLLLPRLSIQVFSLPLSHDSLPQTGSEVRQVRSPRQRISVLTSQIICHVKAQVTSLEVLVFV